MAVTAPSDVAKTGANVARARWRPLEDERWLAVVLLLPTITLLGLFIAYPFVRGILLSVTDARVGVPGEYVGLANFEHLWSDPIFRLVIWNTCWYTFVTTIFKLALGLWLALLLNRHFKFKAFTRAFILLPFIIPTVLSTFAWKWMFDPTFSVLNWMLYKLGFIGRSGGLNWLGDGDLAMWSIIIVNIWRGVPFFAISLLAGLQTISPDLNEAAAIDGAGRWHVFRTVTLPLLQPVLLVVILLRLIDAARIFDKIFIMTRGGPGSSAYTMTLTIYIEGFTKFDFGYASALSLLFQFSLIAAATFYVRRVLADYAAPAE